MAKAVADLHALASAIAEAQLPRSDDRAAARVCEVCADALPCDGAAMTVMSSDAGRQTVFASDEVVGRLESVQYSLGEGPSLLAFTLGRPVLVPDITTASAAGRWPGIVGDVAHLPICAVFCFPMRLGVINVGVCVLYRRTPGGLSREELAFVLEALDLTTLALLEVREGSTRKSLLDRWLAVDGRSRRQVHQATGMLIAQLGVPAEEAFARLRGRAYADGRDIEQIADDIVSRRIRLEPDPA
ncbi:MAG: hypothetical protein QOI06_3373 [Nocardioidaceae bacterium]|jgi:hypothetical protein|nr:hypothetical protein [Nocardioidaceae bacterium]